MGFILVRSLHKMRGGLRSEYQLPAAAFSYEKLLHSHVEIDIIYTVFCVCLLPCVRSGSSRLTRRRADPSQFL